MTGRAAYRTGAVAVMACLLAILPACRHTVLYHHFEHVPAEGWSRTDTLVFCTDTLRQGSTLLPTVTLRVTQQLRHQAIWLIADLCQPDSTLPLRSDTVLLQLTAANGHDYGNGLHLHEHSVGLPPISISQDSVLCIRLRHYLCKERVPGISDVGLCLEGP